MNIHHRGALRPAMFANRHQTVLWAPGRWVNVRVFFKRDDDIGVVSQCLSDTAVQIKLDTDDGIRANNFF
ncbi:MAG: hypothetical protein Ct9H300mP14_07820 [Gammaproteobacteria bacterium]|nr:MAG: hypothetical protein Ct9H300mP14_07820 [Gammaproteobacteria bacterium]